MESEKGQSLLELVVVMAVVVLVVSALTFATIGSLRSANFAKNQAQATKLAQEGVEEVRSIRDRNGLVLNFPYGAFTTSAFADLWQINMSNTCNPCYFKLDPASRSLTWNNSSLLDDLGGGLQRQVQISDDSNWAQEKKIKVLVKWSDFSGIHQSELTTVLRNL